MAQKKYKRLISLKPFINLILQGCSDKFPNNLSDEQISAKDLNNDNSQLEKELSLCIKNFEELKAQKMLINRNFKTLLLNTINNLEPVAKSIFLTILFKKNLSNISWKTFNISKSTFYRKIKLIEKIIKWCFFE
ncbi:hypothetical protein DMC14_001720 [Metamycoplasma phocicerebrale]|uniref:DUF1492 domain-containing protein n=1 Tax=Metamycoplasma phocicerebrale TaxID=142649 RepID=A0A3Q9VBI8_9BACT|nr:hypothetical protein [Metamycoplasma phocicerebrale]AZZ65502.1 hypothetical protein DMC14_001720 [Metamycoplasma phocicerebrale]